MKNGDPRVYEWLKDEPDDDPTMEDVAEGLLLYEGDEP